MNKRAFTLIEMITVIAIIAVLAGLLFPAIGGAMTKAKVAQARSDTKAIESAINQYFTEYGKLPVVNLDQGVDDKYYSGTDQGGLVYTLRAIASGPNTGDALNPKRIVFLDPSNRKNSIDGSGAFLDPWQQPYTVKMDNSYDYVVEYYGNRNVRAVVYSSGQDKTFNTGDDVASVQ